MEKTNKIFRVLFVCTGNTCRSPMAEGILKKMAKEDNLENMDVISAGVSTMDGYPATTYAIKVASIDDIDISHHHSTQLLSNLAAESDLIFALAIDHYERMKYMYPEDGDKIYLLKGFPDGRVAPALSVADPIGMDINEYQKTFDEIKTELIRIWPAIKERYKNEMNGNENSNY